MSDTPTSNVGRMVVELIDHGGTRPHPVITFDPVGRFTPGLIDHYQTLFFQEIERAHARTRHINAHPPPPPAPFDTYDYGITAPELPEPTARRRTR